MAQSKGPFKAVDLAIHCHKSPCKCCTFNAAIIHYGAAGGNIQTLHACTKMLHLDAPTVQVRWEKGWFVDSLGDNQSGKVAKPGASLGVDLSGSHTGSYSPFSVWTLLR